MEPTNRVDEILRGLPPAPAILNRFVALLVEGRPKIEINNPRRALKRALERREYVAPGYHLTDFSGLRLVLEIRDGVLVEIFPVPTLTVHAEERLLERFGVSKKETLLRVVLDIAEGRRLSHTEKRTLLGRKSDSGDVIVNDDRVYLLRGLHVVTVFTPGRK
jgi:hypothetical protein